MFKIYVKNSRSNAWELYKAGLSFDEATKECNALSWALYKFRLTNED